MRVALALHWALWGVGASLAAGLARPALAQSQQVYVPTLDSIGPGCCTIRVWQNGLQAEGRFRGRYDRESVFLEPCKGLLCGAITDPSRGLSLLPDAVVEMRSGSHGGEGLLIGAASGAGLLLGLLLVDNCDDCDWTFGAVAGGAAIGAAVGGAIGVAVGSVIPKWIPVRH